MYECWLFFYGCVGYVDVDMVAFCFSALGLEAKKFIDQGKLVPDEYMIKFILNEIKQVGNKSWLLDGELGYGRIQTTA